MAAEEDEYFGLATFEDEEELRAEEAAQEEAALAAAYEADHEAPAKQRSESGRGTKRQPIALDDTDDDAAPEDDDAAPGEPPSVDCPCGQPASVLTSRSEKNPNRQFYKCQTCGFFEWCDEHGQKHPAAKKARVGGSSSSTTTTRGATTAECPTCAQALSERVSSSEKNPDRKYVKCDSCNYFKWVDELRGGGRPTGTRASPRGPSSPYAASNRGGSSAPPSPAAGARSDACFKCGQTGHWARDCPNAAGSTTTSTTAAGGGGGGSTSRSGNCYKCGGSGHWARDCPGAAGGSTSYGGGRGSTNYGGTSYNYRGGGAQGGGGRGGVGGRSDACYKCGKSGHWARDCPTGG